MNKRMLSVIKPERFWVDGHKMHVFRAGDDNKPKLVFMAGSGTVSPVYDFKILYEKLLSDFRVIVIEKFGYGYSEHYAGPCDIDSLVSFQRKALEKAGEKGPYILMPHSMSGLEAIRWAQKYPEEVKAIIGLDMATPQTYKEWTRDHVEKRIRLMKRMRKLNNFGLLFWLPLNTRGLTEDEIREQRILRKRNAMNNCYVGEAQAVIRNAEAVEAGGTINCPILMFISDGKQVSSNWIKNEEIFADLMNAETIFLNCGHYIHYYESEQISRKIKEYVNLLADEPEFGDFEEDIHDPCLRFQR